MCLKQTKGEDPGTRLKPLPAHSRNVKISGCNGAARHHGFDGGAYLFVRKAPIPLHSAETYFDQADSIRVALLWVETYFDLTDRALLMLALRTLDDLELQLGIGKQKSRPSP